jgi:hypothetical protein
MVWAVLAMLVFDLGLARQEPNLEKRSDLALKNAASALDAARDAYQAGDMAKVKAALEEVGESVSYSEESLEATGKNPRGSGSYKRAEIATRQLLRRIDGLRQLMSAVDREVLDAAQEKVSSVHDQLIQEIMGKRKKK